jgi:hypothetical protein
MLVVACLSLTALAQDDARKLKVSSGSLTKDQVAVYRAVLEDVQKDSKDTLNLANMTEYIRQSNGPFNGSCPKTSDPQIAQKSAPVVDRLDSAVIVDMNIVLVDPGLQEEEIKDGDPAILMKKVIDDRKDVPREQIDDATERAVKNGLLTLSEVSFNTKHNRALVRYSFVCGELCGYGNLLVLTKVGEKWKIHKTCEGWVRECFGDRRVASDKRKMETAVAREIKLRAWLVWDGLRRDEITVKTGGVGVEQSLNAFVTL